MLQPYMLWNVPFTKQPVSASSFLFCGFTTAPSADVDMPCVCRYIDQGRNPQLYTKECLERALARNEQVKGKIDTMTVRDNPRVAEDSPAMMLRKLTEPTKLFH